MGRGVGGAALGCALLACTAAGPREVGAPAADTRAGEFRRVPIGLCEDYPEESRSLEGVRRDFELMRSLGVDSLRVSLGWDAIEPERDRYDLEFWDAFVELATEYRITLIPYVAYTPAWNSDGGEADFWKTPPREPEQFAELMGLLAARYRERIRSWELWNEPDNKDYWLGTAAQYAELVRGGAAAVDAVDPALDVVSGGLAGRIDFLEELFELDGVAARLDVVNLHAYYETWNPDPIETLSTYVGQALDIVGRHGGRQRLWMAEIGYGNHRQGARVSAYTTARFAYEHTLDFQAVALVRSIALLLASPGLERIAWYELKDPPGSDPVIGDANNRHLGVAFADHRPKPSASALAFMLRLFGEGVLPISEGVEVSRAPGTSAETDAEVHVFATPRQTWVVIGWLPTPPQPDGTDAAPASGSGDALDTRRARLHVRAPRPARGAARYYDALGRERPAPEIDASNAPEVDVTLELVGGDVQIVEIPVGD